MGVCIETLTHINPIRTALRSHPIWVCVLKQLTTIDVEQANRHTLYGCVY